MSNINTGIIEQQAVTAVNEALLSTGRITSSIKSGDTTPSWDGEFFVFKDGSGAKDGIKKIPVQVKGSMKADYFDKDFPYFYVSVVDLENWKNDGGVFLFVVHIKPNNEKIVYYVALPVVRIHGLLMENKEKEKIKIPISLFPKEDIDIITIVDFFLLVENCSIHLQIMS